VSERIPQPGPETWLAARLAAGKPAETWKPLPQIDGCSFSGYQASDQGRARSLDRVRNGRPLTGQDVSTRLHKDGYILADFYCDDPAACRKRKNRGKHTFTIHKVVLATFDGPRQPGMQGSHLHGNPAWNWFPEGVGYEDQPANEARKTTRPAPPDPTHPCRNAPACPNLVINPGRRCLDCVAEVGRQAADMLRAGQPLQEVAGHFGYTGPDWVYSLAVRHGGYAGSKAEARIQRPPLTGWRRTAARLLRVS
jgi:hypothetical protein